MAGAAVCADGQEVREEKFSLSLSGSGKHKEKTAATAFQLLPAQERKFRVALEHPAVIDLRSAHAFTAPSSAATITSLVALSFAPWQSKCPKVESQVGKKQWEQTRALMLLSSRTKPRVEKYRK